MTQFDQLKIMNDANILYLKKLNRSYKRNEIIKNILEDETCFFKINKNDAYIILTDIGISNEQIHKVYQELICSKEFYRLLESGKIDLNDEEIIIKYPTCQTEDLFKTRNNKIYKNETIDETKEIIPSKETIIQKIIRKLKLLFKR